MTELEKKQEGNEQPKSASAELIERARSERELLQKENERMEKNIADLRELEASRLLGASSGGRVDTQEMSEEQLKKKQASEFWKGTAISDAIEKYNG